MSDLLSIGASGARAYQSALTTVSENIANVGATGYSRRSTELGEIAPSRVGVTSLGVESGGGVAIRRITRAADAYRSAEVRNSGADLAKTQTSAAWLDRIETSLSGNQLGDRLTSFFNAAKSLASDPSSTTARTVMLEQAATVATSFAATSNSLTQAADDLDATASQAVAQLDGLSSALAKLNGQLGRTPPTSSAAAGLADQRDQLLEQMSALTDLNVSIDAVGRATVRVANPNGALLVAGDEASHVVYERNAAGTVSYSAIRGTVPFAMTPGGGALAGFAEGAQRIADARAALDAVAGNFVDGVNAVQAQGRDLDGNPGAAMFAIGGGAATVTAVLDDPSKIAAAAPGGGARDNSNLANFATLRTSGAFEGKVTQLTASNAAALEQRRAVAEAQSAIRDNAVTARDTISGVNLDSEAVDLIRFQQAYSASSRVIQVARETIQTLLDIR